MWHISSQCLIQFMLSMLYNYLKYSNKEKGSFKLFKHIFVLSLFLYFEKVRCSCAQ